jgi:GT2 family glycosyltransferase
MNEFELTGSLVTFLHDPEDIQSTISCFSRTGLRTFLFVYDNSPTPELGEHIKGSDRAYIFDGSNVGFGKAHNRCMTNVLERSRYHLVLNPDIEFDPGTLEKLYAYMEAHPDVGLVLPRVTDFDGQVKHLCKRLPSPIDLVLRRLGGATLQRVFRKRMDRYEMQDKNYDASFDAPYLSGCFMFFRTEALKKTGLFDERFFMYMEDVDLSRRVHQQFRTVYYPEVTIRHGHARESYRFNALFFAHIKSAIRYFNKWGWFFDAERTRVNRRL